MVKSDYFFIGIVSFLFGILGCSFYVEGSGFEGGLILLFCLVFVYRFSAVDDKVSWWPFLIMVLFLFFGIARFYFSSVGNVDVVAKYEGFVEFEGCIVEEPDVRVDRVKYVVESALLGRILVFYYRYPLFDYGDCLFVAGDLELPGIIEGFDYRRYLSRFGIYGVIYKSSIVKIAEWRGNLFFKKLYEIKKDFEKKLERIYAEPFSSFMSGLILGSRRGIKEDLIDKFNVTGLTHIIAISGYNVALVIFVVSAFLGFLSLRWRIFASIVFVFLFVLLVGASASVVRAGIMGVISLLALLFGRQYVVFLGLFFSAFLMSLWNPKIIFFDVSFQLSFLATLGIVIFSSRLEKALRFLPNVFLIRESLMMTLAAQIFVLPIIIVNFERLSLISPISNMFVLPFIPFAMIFGFLAVLSSFVSMSLAGAVGFFGFIVLRIVIFFVDFFSGFPLASLEIGGVVFFICYLYYFWMMKLIIDNWRL